jgi:hypothetical protein
LSDVASGTGSVSGTAFSGFETLTGGSATDTLSFSGHGAAVTLTLTAAGSGQVSDLIAFTGMNAYTGSGHSDTLVAPDTDNAWVLTGSNTGTLNGAAFGSFEHLTGGAGADTLSLTAGDALSGRFDGGGGVDHVDYSGYGSTVSVNLDTGAATLLAGGIANVERITGGSGSGDTLTGTNAGDIWILTGSNAGTVGNLAFSAFENLTGGSGDDAFLFAGDAAAATVRIDGGTGSDSIDLSGRTTAVAIDLTNQRITGPGTVVYGFRNIESLIGTGLTDSMTGASVTTDWTLSGANSGSVRFTANAGPSAGSLIDLAFSSVENLTGGSGTDRFALHDGGSLSGTLAGGAGTDTLNYSARTDAVAVNLATASATGLNAFSGIESFVGSAFSDTLTGLNATATWTVNNTAASGGSVSGYSFSGFENLVGGSGSDTLSFSGNGSAVTVTLTSASTGSATGIESFTGMESYSGSGYSDTLVATDTTNAWVLTGSNVGTLNGTSFSSFENLTGGAGADTLSLTSGDFLSGRFDGGAGSDHINYAGYSSSISVNLASRTASQLSGGFANIEQFTASGYSADYLYGTNTGDTWTLTGVNTGSVASADGSTVAFAGFEYMTGGSGDDTFLFANNSARATVQINGGGGTDTVDFSGRTSALTFDLVQADAKSGSTVILARYTGVETVVGSQATDSILGANTTTDWTVDAPDAGRVTFTVPQPASSGPVTLAAWDFDNGSWPSGWSTGGNASWYITSSNYYDWPYSLRAGTITHNQSTSVSFYRTYGSGETLTFRHRVSSERSYDYLRFIVNGTEVASWSGEQSWETYTYSMPAGSYYVEWRYIKDGCTDHYNDTVWIDDISITRPGTTYTGLPAGTPVDLRFSGIENLTAGTGNDRFRFANDGALSGTLTTGGGTDTLDYSGYGSAVSVNLATGQATGMTAMSGFASFIGSAHSDTLIGRNASTTWTVNNTANAAGSVSGFSFSSFENLVGGSGTDTLSFSGNGNAVTVTLTSNTSGAATGLASFSGMEQYTGSGYSDTLIGPDTDNTWSLSGTNAGYLNSRYFTSFEHLTGGAGADTLTLNGYSLSGRFDGGAGDDHLSYAGYGSTVSVNLATGAATLLSGGIANVERITGGSGSGDTLTGTNAGDTWTLTGSNAGTVGSLAFSAFENLTGGSGNDRFVFDGDAAAATVRIDGGTGSDSIDLSGRVSAVAIDLANQRITGPGTVVQGFRNIESVVGTGQTDSMTGANLTTDWTLSELDTGRVRFTANAGPSAGSLIDLAFTGVENLTGGSGIDRLAMLGAATLRGSFNAGSGTDSLSYAGYGSAASVDLANGTATGLGAMSGFESFTGSAFSDTLSGLHANATWTVNNTANAAGSVSGYSFASFEHLVGGSGTDTLSFSGNTTAVIVTLADQASGTASGLDGFSGMESYTGSGQADTLIGPDTDNAWVLTGANVGTLNGTVFTSFEHLTGGAGADTLTLTTGDSLAGRFDGGAGSDHLDYAAYGSAVSVNLGAGTATALGGIANIEQLTGSALADSLTGTDAGDTWTLTGVDAGSVAGVAFAGIEHLSGGAGDDVFAFADDAARVTGSLSGGFGTDALDFSARGTGIEHELAASSIVSNGAVVVALYRDIETSIGTAGTDRLIGPDSGTEWSFSGAEQGSVVYSVSVAGEGTKVYASGVHSYSSQYSTGGWSAQQAVGAPNTFAYGDISTAWTTAGANSGVHYIELTYTPGRINAVEVRKTFGYGFVTKLEGRDASGNLNLLWAGTDPDILPEVTETRFDFAPTSYDVYSVRVTIDTNVTSSWEEIDAVAVYPWTVTGYGGAQHLSFSGYEQIDAGDGDDSFTMTGEATFSGTIDAGAGSDTLSYAGYGSAVTVDLRGDAWSATGLTGSLAGIESVAGSAHADTLIAPDGASTWAITGTDTGTVNGLPFASFEHLISGADDDSFVVSGAGVLTGSIDAGLGADVLDFSAAASGVTVSLDRLAGIEILVGSAHADRLTGSDEPETWLLDGAGAGSVGDLAFSAFETINGGAGDDAFTLTPDGRFTSIDGGSGADSLTFTATAAAETLSLIAGVLSLDGTTLASVAGLEQITLDAGDGDDEITIAPAAGADLTLITVHGGAALNDRLTVTGDSFALGDGQVLVGSSLIRYDGIEALALESGGGNASLTTAVSVAMTDNQPTFNLATLPLAIGPDIRLVFAVTLQGTEDADSITLDGTSLIFNGVTTNIASFTELTIDGLGGDDQFLITNAPSHLTSLTLVGGAGADTLTGPAAGLTWNLTGAGSGSLGDPASPWAGFAGFESLSGGAGADSFRLTGTGALTGTLAGGGGTDSLSYADYGAAVAIDLGQGSATAIAGGITGIEQLIGSAGRDQLTGTDGGDTWALTGADAGTVAGVAFSGFEDLIGGAGDDLLAVGPGASLSGGFSGGAGSNTLDFSGADAGIAISLATASGGGLAGFDGIGQLIGSAFADTLTGPDADSAWSLTGLDAGSVAGIGFTGFEHLTGGSGADSFAIASGAGLTGTLDGGQGTDRIDYSAWDSAISIAPTAGIATGFGAIANLEGVTGGSAADTMIGGDAGAIWTLTGANAGDLDGFAFSGIEHLSAGSGDDLFRLQGGSLSGDLSGGGGSDTLDYSGHGDDVLIDLGSGAATALGGWSGIETLVGTGAAAASTLQGSDADTDWTLTGADAGSVGGWAFSGFANLTGGSGADRFAFGAGASLSGMLTGGSGSDHLDFSALGSAVTVDLGTGSASVIQAFTGIETLTGSALADHLIGTDAGDTWNLTGADVGSVAGIAFSGFEAVTGGSGDDHFVIGAAGSLSGTLTGGAGTDHLDYSGYGQAVTVELGTGTYTALGAVTGIERLTGSASYDLLVGTDAGDDWLLDGANRGTVAGVGFDGFEFIKGGVGDDQFTLTADARFAAGVNAGDGDDLVRVLGTAGDDLLRLAGREVQVNGQVLTTLWGFRQAALIGGDGNDRLQVVAGSGLPARLVLDGGAGDDHSEVRLATTGALQIALIGGAGNDHLALTGGTGNDSYDLAVGSLVMGANRIDHTDLETIALASGGGNDELLPPRGATIEGRVVSLGETLIDVAEDIDLRAELIIGGTAGDDLIRLDGNRVSVNGVWTDFSAYIALIIEAGAGDDRIELLAPASADIAVRVRGGTGSDRLVGPSAMPGATAGTAPMDWTVLAADAGTVGAAGRTWLDFDGIDHLVGSADADRLHGGDAGGDWRLFANGSGSLDGLGFSGMGTLLAGTGEHRLTIDASTATTGQGVTLAAARVAGLALATPIAYSGFAHLDLLLGSGRDVLVVQGTHAGSTHIDTGDGDDQISVQANTGALSIDAGAGDDRLLLGSAAPWYGGVLDGLVGALTLVGGSGSDALSLDDSGATQDRSGTLAAAQISGFGLGDGVAYSAFEALELLLGSGADQVQVTGTPRAGAWDATVTSIDTGAGDDQISIALSAATDGALVVNAGAGDDRIDAAAPTCP